MDAIHEYCDSFGLHWNALGTKFQMMVKRAIHIIYIESQVDRLNDYDCRVCMRPLMCVKQLSAAESH